MRSNYILLFILTFFVQTAFAQERCAQVALEKINFPKGFQKKEDAFESWIKNKIQSRHNSSINGRIQAGPYIIPVVVHVIHNGEAIGTGTNISDAQIQSQIQVLNEDFNRKNTDASATLDAFKSVAGSVDIQFMLAKQNPNGLPTNGIVRVKGTQSGWTLANEKTFKSLSYWPSENYLNIWVINFSDQYIGFAQLPLPTGTNLNGLDESVDNAATDGVVIHYQTFGSSFTDLGSFNLLSKFNRGRTATHEVGHFFGLKHIWGDDSGTCSGTDYVSDTPNQSNSSSSCSSPPQQKSDACSTSIMFQNYMDYTDDVCMNLFTQGQVQRMDVVINNSPRRASLLTSLGATSPSGTPITDLAVSSLRSPGPVVCITSLAPVVTISNLGSTTITTLQVETRVNSGVSTSQSFSGLQLLPGNEHDFTLNKVTLNSGLNTMVFTVQNPNGGIDDNISNNSLALNEVVNQSEDVIPLRENFNSDFSDWTTVSPRNNLNWQTTATNNNTSLGYRSFTNTNKGQEAWLVSPVLDFTSTTRASALFDVSYATRSTGEERLQIFSSTDCGVTYSETQYDHVGSEFNSSSATSSWQPSTQSDWQRQFVELSDLAGKENIRLAFVVTNENGNNLYIDNLEFYVSDDSNPPVVNAPYYVYATSTRMDEYAITFNLTDRSDVQLYMYDLLGQKVADQFLPNTLNQTYPIEFTKMVTGIYIIRLKIGNELSSAKIYVGR